MSLSGGRTPETSVGRSPEIERRDFLKAAGAGAAALALPGWGMASRRPNIIFVLADDLGYGDLGSYGQERIRTPRLDAMAAEGMRFTDHYAGSTVCAPSRCVLMTGLHTGHCRVRGNARVPLEPGDLTVAEVLRDAGYATGLVGKWGLGEEGSTGMPTRQGFDEFFGYLNQRHAHNYYPDFLYRNEKRVPLENVMPEGSKEGHGVAREKKQYSHDLFIDEALGFVKRHKSRPFFLYLALTIPHANNEAGGKGMEVPSFESYENEEWPDPQKGHAAMITRMDRDVGRLLDTLDELGIGDDTVVFFSSDNGPHREGGAKPDFFRSNGALRGIKRDLYEGGIRVPLIARWPGRIEPGSVSRHASAFQDFMPTMAELAGGRVPGKIDGISMKPTLLGQPDRQKKHDYLYWEFHERGSKQAVRTGRWKGVRFIGRESMELYDLETDPGEKNDLAAGFPDVAARIGTCLAKARTENEHWRLKARK